MYRGNGFGTKVNTRPPSLPKAATFLDETESAMAYEGRQETMIDRYSRGLLLSSTTNNNEISRQAGGESTRNARMQKSNSVG